MLLVDEIDRADDEFEAFLLEVLCDCTDHRSPSSARSAPQTPPLVVLTSNRTREVHDALKRRCLYHWLEHPDFDREVAIVRRRVPEVSERLAREVARGAARLRGARTCSSRPGVAEIAGLGPRRCSCSAPRDLDAETAAPTLGAVREVPRGRGAGHVARPTAPPPE